MLSLANSYNADDLTNSTSPDQAPAQYARRMRILTYVVEPKFDGGSIALVYEADQLTRAATRGNGVEGEEMTANARVIRSPSR
jgi:DNA ligase (NAD+)